MKGPIPHREKQSGTPGGEIAPRPLQFSHLPKQFFSQRYEKK